MFKYLKGKFKTVWEKTRLFFHALWVSIAIFFGSQVVAFQDVTWSWTPPTEYVDNTPILEGAIEGYKLYCNGEDAISIPNVTNFTKSLSPGTYVCYVTVTAHGIESDPSNSTTKVIDWPQPKPPVLSED